MTRGAWWLGVVHAVAIAAAAPVTVTQATRLELQANGRAAGTIGLKAGEQLELMEPGETHLMVRYRNVTGRVPVADTDWRSAPPVVAPDPASAPAAGSARPLAPDREAPPREAPRADAPTGPIARVLAGKLVGLEGGAMRPLPAERLAGVRFFALYFSAGWCGPCREFTPELVDAYGKIRALYPEFEVVLVNRDRSPAAMAEYMRADRMPWPALAWEAIRGAREINRYAGSGIPCLVLVDERGNVLADTYRRGNYAGPSAVLDDTWKILRDHRRKHPRPKP
jgi:nucleoredoxin